MFLTDTELIELTGWRRVFDQRRWLKAHGWKFEISGIGRPVVMRRHAEQKMLDAADAKPAPPPVQHSSRRLPAGARLSIASGQQFALPSFTSMSLS